MSRSPARWPRRSRPFRARMVTGERACSTQIAARTRRPVGPGSLFSASRGESTTECSIARATNVLSRAAGLRWSRRYIPTACSGGCSGLGISRERRRQTRPRSTASARFCSQVARSTRLRSDQLRARVVATAALQALIVATAIYSCSSLAAKNRRAEFKVIAFYTAQKDQAHISFVHEAERWFPEMAAKYNFGYDTTSNWQNLNSDFLSKYQVVVFLDTRPEEPPQRAAFQAYMEHGGAWMGFHFAGFALTPSAYPANWDWYHNTFLGSGSYVS